MNEHLLKRNKERFDYLNITEWQEHCTGKGIKVGILGYDAGTHHNGADLINQVAPDVEVIEYGVYQGSMTWEQAFKQMLYDHVDVVCCSLRKNSWPIELEYYSKQLYENNVIMIDSSDNEDEEIDAWPAMSKYWFVSGAYNEKRKDRAAYSNYGPKLDFLSYTNYYSKNYKGSYVPISHTSGTSQVPCGIAALLKEYWGNFGPEEFKQFIMLNSIDLQEEGKDSGTGWGLLTMPSYPQEGVDNVNKTVRDLNELHPHVKFLAELLKIRCKEQGIEILITETYRSFERQQELYNQGRTTPGSKVTNAKAGSSMHNYRLAFDIVPIVDGEADWNNHTLFDQIGEIGKSIGLTWGGNFITICDKPHFQWTDGLSISDLKNGEIPVDPIPKWYREGWNWAAKNNINDGIIQSDWEVQFMTFLYKFDKYLDTK